MEWCNGKSHICLCGFPETERRILEMQVSRMRAGLHKLGPWNLNDGRVWLLEAIEESLDNQNYLSAALLQLHDRVLEES